MRSLAAVTGVAVGVFGAFVVGAVVGVSEVPLCAWVDWLATCCAVDSTALHLAIPLLTECVVPMVVSAL